MRNRPLPVTLDGAVACFSDGAGHAVRATPAEVRGLYHVRAGSDVYADDEEFWLFVLDTTGKLTNSFLHGSASHVAW
jgi:hypothetical protein